MRHHIIPILCAIHHIILLFCSCSRSGDGDLPARNLAMAIFLLAICSCSRLFFFLLANLAVGRLDHLGNISSYEFLLGPDCYSGVRSDDWSRNKSFSRNLLYPTYSLIFWQSCLVSWHFLQSKGDGCSQGFDAHLNIEQMNKTSVELFHMYDDDRKKGMSVSTEGEVHR